jgi:hypothetical protein
MNILLPTIFRGRILRWKSILFQRIIIKIIPHALKKCIISAHLCIFGCFIRRLIFRNYPGATDNSPFPSGFPSLEREGIKG